MPTYEDLRAYFNESSKLRDVAERASRVPIFMGVALDVDPIWALLHDEQEALIAWPPSDPQRFALPADLSDLDEWVFQTDIPIWWNTRYQGYRRRNLFLPVKRWDQLIDRYRAQRERDRLPVLMTIVHRPLRAPKSPERNEDAEALRELVLLIRESNLASVRIEERPPARLSLAGGDKISVGGTRSGTFGGLLRDSVGSREYGVTCAHVAGTGDTVSDGIQSVGKCVADSTRVALPSGKGCDPANLAMPNPYPGNGPDVNMLDCALIHMSIKAPSHKLAGIAPSLTQGQNVVLHGGFTKSTKHKLGSLCISYQFTEAGQDYCFRDAIELIPQPWGPVGGAIGQLMTTVPQQGDSGGWVLTDTQPTDWAAMLFGEDGTRGFAIRATWVHQWAEKAAGAVLTV